MNLDKSGENAEKRTKDVRKGKKIEVRKEKWNGGGERGKKRGGETKGRKKGVKRRARRNPRALNSFQNNFD